MAKVTSEAQVMQYTPTEDPPSLTFAKQTQHVSYGELKGQSKR